MIDGYIVLAIVALQSAGHIVIAMMKERRYQSTIDRLTDKLMAKDYSEYKRHDKLTEVKEERTRKPLSYYDDTSIEDETETP